MTVFQWLGGVPRRWRGVGPGEAVPLVTHTFTPKHQMLTWANLAYYCDMSYNEYHFPARPEPVTSLPVPSYFDRPPAEHRESRPAVYHAPSTRLDRPAARRPASYHRPAPAPALRPEAAQHAAPTPTPTAPACVPVVVPVPVLLPIVVLPVVPVAISIQIDVRY